MNPNIFQRHKAALVQVSRAPTHTDYTKRNDDLETVIAAIKQERPEAFLTAEDLAKRVFVHTPPSREGREPMTYMRSIRDHLSPAEKADRKAAHERRQGGAS